jgi:YidC/Oxa1 family membrane protein insertase
MNAIFEILGAPMGYILRFAYSITNDFLLSIMLFTLVMEIILLPLGIKQQKNQVKQASFAPRIAAIKKKYAGRNDQATQQKMQNEIMSLYQSENYNPAGGCLPMILQLVVIFAIYQIVYGPLTYLCSMSAEAVSVLKEGIKLLQEVETYTGNQIQMLHDISVLGIEKVMEVLPTLEGYTEEIGVAIGDVLRNPPNMTVFGGKLDLSATPTVAFNLLLLIPVLNLVTTWASTKITRKFTYQSPDAAQMNSSMKIMEITTTHMVRYIYPSKDLIQRQKIAS